MLTKDNFGKYQFGIKCQVGLIACMDLNHLIGFDGKIPWNHPADLKRFKNITTNNVVVMGRKTYESIGKPLPNRDNIIVSHNAMTIPGTTVCTMSYLLDNLKNLSEDKKVWIIGGKDIYKQALILDICDILDITIINGVHLSGGQYSMEERIKKSVYFPQIPLKFSITNEEINPTEPILLHRTYKRIEW
jgi:dihydrofolate reductase